MRLDLYIFDKFLLKSRSFAENVIKKGKVTVNGATVVKPSFDVTERDIVTVDTGAEFESLGGDKLEKALDTFKIDLKDKKCVDIGASNGGFTDCMLRRGAKNVYAVDVAECAFSEKLLTDKRVFVRDRLNARYIKPDDVDGLCGFVSVDVSFISLTLVLKSCFELLDKNGEMIALIKPQFEQGKRGAKSGIVLNPADRLEAVQRVLAYAAAEDIFCAGLTSAPDIFKKKNVEYLAYFVKSPRGGRPVKTLCIDAFKNL